MRNPKPLAAKDRHRLSLAFGPSTPGYPGDGFRRDRKSDFHRIGEGVAKYSLKNASTHPNDRVEAELPAGCFHSPIKVSLRRAAKLLTLALAASKYLSGRCSALLPPVRLGPPCRRPILIATKHLVFREQDTIALRHRSEHWLQIQF